MDFSIIGEIDFLSFFDLFQRPIASQYPYDTFNDDALTPRGNTTAVSDELKKELQERLAVAGVEVIETRLNHLAYATEIASAMLQLQHGTGDFCCIG